MKIAKICFSDSDPEDDDEIEESPPQIRSSRRRSTRNIQSENESESSDYEP